MLRSLVIRDFVIVERAELEFRAGFTALTGETGAGKSILVDALLIVLGGRADATIIRNGAERADVSAEFDVSRRAEVREWLRDNALEGDDAQCLLRRLIDSSGRSRGYVNGHMATMQQLRNLGEQLVDVHGQHVHQSLLRPAAQRELLDAYAGVTALAGQVAQAFRNWRRLSEQRAAFEADAARFAREREDLEWQVRDLAQLNLGPDEWGTLSAEHARLAHAASLIETAEFVLETLSEADTSCTAQLNVAVSRLNAQLEFDATLKQVLDELAPAQIQLQEAVHTLRHYQQRLELDPQRLRESEQRLEAIHGAARKFRVNPVDLPSKLEALRARFAELEQVTDIEALLKQETAAQALYQTQAARLSAERNKAAQRLSAKVTAGLQKLAMAGGKFEVALEKLEQGTAAGSERIEFMVAAHPGIALRPLNKVASGGELSRISLAVQSATIELTPVPTLVFDEVDSGIGGGVAQIVGQMLHALGRKHQVMCVTHLAQVAASADQQWQVSKTTRDGTTVSQVTVLDDRQRVDELARMLGGVKITETTRKHAAEMLGVKS